MPTVVCYNNVCETLPGGLAIRIAHLTLTNFRNYKQLELDLPPDIAVLQGDNAQGKTNFFEAIYLLATTRSQRATAERELISWSIPKDEPVVARLVAQVQKTAANLQVELVLTTTNHSPETLVQKRIKINGVPRRAIDVIGQLNVVLFSPADIDLIGGAPSLRRRYLDITISQFNHRYLRSLQRYNKVLQQRNHLLKLIAEHHANVDQLDFWDKELLEHGGYIAEQRLSAVCDLNVLSQPIHHEISSGENLQINYVPSASEDFSESLKRIRQEEIARGMSLMGPHRDDLKFIVNDSDIGIYGSRGQQRTVALSLRLAETRLLQSKTGEEPVMLLDDVLSELDATRRHHLLSSVSSYQQVLITTTDLDHFDPDFLDQATLLRVSSGNITPMQT